MGQPTMAIAGRVEHRPTDEVLRELALGFVCLGAEQIGAAIQDAQARLVRALGLKCCVLMELDDPTPGTLSPISTYSYPPFIHPGDHSSCQPSKCSACLRVLREGMAGILPDDGRHPDDSGNGKVVCAQGCSSVVGFPLMAGERIIGAVVFASADDRAICSEQQITQLEFVAQVFTGALERKRAGRGQPANPRDYRELLEKVKGIVWRADAATLRCTYVNSAVESILGYPREEWMETREVWVQRIHPEDRERVLALAAQGIREQRDYEFEHRMITADGRTVWLHKVVHVVVENGLARELIGIDFDITQLKETKESLRRTIAEVERLKSKLQEENVYLRQKSRVTSGHYGMIGQTEAFRRVLAQAEQVAPTDSTVLLLGETGTGKELLAAFIHDSSARRDRTLVTVNCAAMPGPLAESELFGREKGAFTGSLARQVGRFELADESTIFLDEIGELSLEIQAKLLRVLEARQIERLGNPKPISLNVRIIAATNRDLEKQIAEGKFRHDLYYRLNVFPISVPPLRERREDIPLLVWAFVDEFAKTFNKNIESIERESLDSLQRYSWPGNVRELRNVVERAMIVATGPKLHIQLPTASVVVTMSVGRSLQQVEREHVQSVLEQSGWRVRGPKGAAQTLGLKPTTLEARMAKLGIRRPNGKA